VGSFSAQATTIFKKNIELNAVFATQRRAEAGCFGRIAVSPAGATACSFLESSQVSFTEKLTWSSNGQFRLFFKPHHILCFIYF